MFLKNKVKKIRLIVREMEKRNIRTMSDEEGGDEWSECIFVNLKIDFTFIFISFNIFHST